MAACPALVLSPPAAPARLEDFSGLPPAYSFVGDGEPFYAETVHYFERLRAAGVPAQLDVYHCDMHPFDMMRPQDAAQRRGGGDIQQTVRLCAGALFRAAAGSGRWRGESTMIFYFSATETADMWPSAPLRRRGSGASPSRRACRRGSLHLRHGTGRWWASFRPSTSGGLPSIVNAFLERLILGRPEYLWFAATYGTTTGQAGRFVSEHLCAKGLRLDARFSVRMPDRWTPMFDLSDKAKV